MNKNTKSLVGIIIANSVTMSFIIALFFVGRVFDPKDQFIFNFNYGYLALTMLGVLFYLMAKYRKLRKNDTFYFGKYWFDYIYRIFQALIYTTILQNITILGDSKIAMVIVSLFIGTYISKIEKSFEWIGDLLSVMLLGLFGVTSFDGTSEEIIQRSKYLFESLKDVRNIYNQKSNLSERAKVKIDNKFKYVERLIKRKKFSKAEVVIAEIDYLLIEIDV